jgi:hypothetical protein
LVPIAVAVPFGEVSASAFVDRTRSVADAAGVECPDAIVPVVAKAIVVFVRWARSAAHAEGVELVPVAVAVAFGKVSASAFVHVTRSVAHAACVKRSDTVVHVVAHAVAVLVAVARSAAHA